MIKKVKTHFLMSAHIKIYRFVIVSKKICDSLIAYALHRALVVRAFCGRGGRARISKNKGGGKIFLRFLAKPRRLIV